MAAPRDLPKTLAPWEWLAAIALSSLALVVLRPASLSTPYWWDAGAVYVPGAQWLTEHGFDASPGTFPSDLGRGHTPGFYLVLALVFRVFGTSPTSGHALVFGASSLALTFTYALGALWLGRVRGALAAMLLVCSPLYLTMSSEALPEIPMTALTIAALYAFARERHALAAALCTALILCKEVGVACPLALGAAALFFAWRVEGAARRAWVRAAAWQALPLVVLVAFFAWQRLREGWFVLPYHAGLFKEHHDFVHQIRRVVGSSVADDGRWVAVLAAAALLGFARWTKASRPSALATARPLALAMALVVLANFVFFAKMFFLERYVLPLHPLVVLAIAWALPDATPRLRGLSIAAVALACALGVRARWDGEGFDSGETTFRYLHAIRVHQRVLGSIPKDQTVLTTWPMTDELRRPYLGYVTSPIHAISLEYVEATGSHPDVDAVVVFDTMGNAPRLRAMAEERGFHLRRREVEGGAAIELWER